ncbi:MAG: hypothetical protein ACT4NY_22740 [Pseudonocardiales bacterium]
MAPSQLSGPADPGPASTPAGGEPPASVQRPEGYEVQQYESDGWFGGVIDQLQRWGLAEGVTMRPPADIPRTNARSYEHPELKAMIDTSTHQQVDELGEMWNKLGNDIMNFGASLHRTATSIDAVWEGEAGLAARNMLIKLAKWSEQTGQGVQYMGTTMRTQGDAAGKAKADMPEPVPYEPAVYQDQINSTNNPFQWIKILGDARENFEQHNTAREEAIRVTETYSTSLHNTNGTMPAFTPPPEFGSGDTSLTPGKPTPGGGGGGLGGSVPPMGGAGGGAPGGVPGIGGTTPPGVGDRPPSSTPVQVAPGTPNPGSPGIPPGGRPPGWGGDGGTPGILPAAAIGVPGRPVPGGGRVPGGGFGRGGGGFGPQGSAGTSNPPGHPNQQGRGGGPTGAAEAAGRGAVGPAGRSAGPGGMLPPMAGAGRGRGEEDIERRRPSYLIETEDVWGDGRRVAPPVIGEDPPDYYPKDKR